MKKRLCILCMMVFLILTAVGCKSSNDKDKEPSSSSSPNVSTDENIDNDIDDDDDKDDEDSTLVMFASDKAGSEFYDVYAKYAGKDIKKIASSVSKPDETKFLNDKYYYLEDENDIFLIDKNYSLLKYNRQGKSETLVNNIASELGFELRDKGVVAYYNLDNKLAIKDSKGKAHVLNTDDMYLYAYELSDDGKYLYYRDVEGNLRLYNDGKDEIICKNVIEYRASKNGKTVVFSYSSSEGSNKSALYIKNVGDKKYKEIFDNNYGENYKIYNDGTVAFLYSDKKYNDESAGDLYYYNGKNTVKISEYVCEYIRRDNKIYFTDLEGNLNEKDLTKKGTSQIASNVNFMVDVLMKTTEDGLLFVNENNELFYKENDKKAQKIDTLKDAEKRYFTVIDDDEFVYLNDKDQLFIGDDKIAEKVDSFVASSESIAYIKANKVHLYNVDSERYSVVIDNVNDYEYIFLENEQLYVKE